MQLHIECDTQIAAAVLMNCRKSNKAGNFASGLKNWIQKQNKM